MKQLFFFTFFTVVCLQLLFFNVQLFGQGEANNWYFGNHAGITFNTTPPSALTDGQVNTQEGCASISDRNGNLLFYTDGKKVWNKNHQVMPNGTGLYGHASSTQSGIIIPKPGNSKRYYIITVPDRFQTGADSHMYYSEVDMSLNGGLGDIVSSQKNVLMLNNSSEKVAVVRHDNGIDYWIIARKLATTEKSYYAFLLTCNGINTTAVESSNVAVVSANSHGYMVASPNGHKIALANGNDDSAPGLELADFDKSNGLVSNCLGLGVVESGKTIYGLAFSPNNNLLYASSTSTIVQYNLTLPNANIAGSKINIATVSGYNAIQLGPDGKLYVSITSSNYLSVIHNPNTLGINCNYTPNAIYLAGKTSGHGLPPFVSSFFVPETNFSTDYCVGDPVQFDFSSTSVYDGIKWLFGDGDSSLLASTTHIYEPGAYEIQLIKYATCNDTIKDSIFIPELVLSNDTLICLTETNNVPLSATLKYATPLGHSWFSLNQNSDTTFIATTPSVTVFPTTDSTFHYKTKVKTGTNLVVNGDFEQGNVGFTTEYLYMNSLFGTGGYDFVDVACSKTGKAMNASAASGNGHGVADQASFWCQTITVEPNTDYLFSYFFVNKNYGSGYPGAQISFHANGVQIGNNMTGEDATNNCDWQEFSIVWNSGNNISVDLCLHEMSAIAAGADFFIDDISFYKLCPIEDSVFVRIDSVKFTVIPKDIICKGESNGTITVTMESGIPLYEYQIDSDPFKPYDLMIDSIALGTHTITIRDSAGCTAQKTFDTNEPDTKLQIEMLSHKHTDCPNEFIGNVTVKLKASHGWGTPYTYTFNDENPTGDSLTGVGYGNHIVYITDSLGCTDSLEFTITKPDPLKIELLKQQNVLCFEQSNGSVKIKVSGGIPDPTDPNDSATAYTYSWKDANNNELSTTDSLNNLSAGWYYITISDSANLCTIQDSFKILQPNLLTVTEDFNLTKNVSCFNGSNGSITVKVEGGTAPYSYSWDHDPVNLTPKIEDINATTVYKVTITDSNNCTVSGDFSVSQPELLVATIANFTPVKCYGESNGTALSSVTGGNGNYTYLWNDVNLQTTSEANNLSEGTYKVIITDILGCKDSAEVVISQPDELILTIDTLIHLSCFGTNDGSAIVKVTGGNGNNVFSWSDGQIGTSVSNLSFGTHIATVTDSKGCEKVINIFINQPPKINTVFFASKTQNAKCSGESSGTATVTVLGGTEPYSYLWSNGQTDSVAINLSAGTYYVTVKDSNNCEVKDSITILNPPPLTITVTADNLNICPYEPAQLHASASGGLAPLTITWGSGFNAWDISTQLSSDTTFQATVTDNNGCKDSAQVHLTVSILPTVMFNDEIRKECLNSTIAFHNLSTGNFTNCEWIFSNGEVFNECGTLIYETNTLGYQDITLKLYNADGCFVEHTGYNILYTMLRPIADFQTDKQRYDILETDVYFTNLSQNATDYLWDFGDLSPVSTEENPSHVYPYWQEGNYEIVLISSDSISQCSDTARQIITIYETEIFYIPNTFTPENDGVNDLFKPIITSGILPVSYQFEIYNRWGELIFETQDPNEGWNGIYKGEYSITGVYPWRIRIQYKENAKRQEYIGHVNLLR